MEVILKVEKHFLQATKRFDKAVEKGFDANGPAYAADALAVLIADLKEITVTQAYDYLYDKYNLRKE